MTFGKYIFILFFVCFVPRAMAVSYRNVDYRFSINIPDGDTICIDPSVTSNHEVVILLDSTDCDKKSTLSYILFFTSYNVAWEAKTTSELSEKICDSHAGTKTDVKINGIYFYKCIGAKNEKSITYFTLRPEAGVEEAGWTKFEVTLYCPNRKCDAREIIRILRGMRLQ